MNASPVLKRLEANQHLLQARAVRAISVCFSEAAVSLSADQRADAVADVLDAIAAGKARPLARFSDSECVRA